MDFDAHTNDSEDDYNAFVDRIVNSTTEELRQASDKTEKQELALRRYFHLAYKANLSPSEAWDFWQLMTVVFWKAQACPKRKLNVR